jgi:hypothetical protein
VRLGNITTVRPTIFLFHWLFDDVFIEGVHHNGLVLNLASLLPTTNLEGKVIEDALKALPLLVKEN